MNLIQTMLAEGESVISSSEFLGRLAFLLAFSPRASPPRHASHGFSHSTTEPRATTFSASKRRVTTVAQSAVMSALIAVLTVTAFPLPPPLSAITLAPVAIFVGSVFLGPRVGFLSAVIGSGLGFTIAATVGTIAGAPPGSALFPIFLAGIVVARGPEGYLIGTLRKKNEVLSMVVGTVYETLAFFVIDFFYTYPIFLGLPNTFAYLDFGTLIDLIFIIPSVAVLRYLRSNLGIRYYDEGRSQSHQ